MKVKLSDEIEQKIKQNRKRIKYFEIRGGGGSTWKNDMSKRYAIYISRASRKAGIVS